MTDIIGNLNGSITLLKGIHEICKIYDNAILMKEISDLNMQLAQTQNEAAQMMTRLQTLETELEERQNNPLCFTGAVYFDNEKYPYCPACYDNNRKRIHLKATPKPNGYHVFHCPVCTAHYHEEDR